LEIGELKRELSEDLDDLMRVCKESESKHPRLCSAHGRSVGKITISGRIFEVQLVLEGDPDDWIER